MCEAGRSVLCRPRYMQTAAVAVASMHREQVVVVRSWSLDATKTFSQATTLSLQRIQWQRMAADMSAARRRVVVHTPVGGWPMDGKGNTCPKDQPGGHGVDVPSILFARGSRRLATGPSRFEYARALLAPEPCHAFELVFVWFAFPCFSPSHRRPRPSVDAYPNRP